MTTIEPARAAPRKRRSRILGVVLALARGFALVIALLLVSSAGALAQRSGANGYVAEHEAASKALVARMNELAEWCQSSSLYAERDRVWHAVLEFDPENLDARRGLRCTRDSEGRWTHAAPRDSQNRNPKALAELGARRRSVVEPFRSEMIELLRREPDPALLRALYREILIVDPDDVYVRAVRGEVRLDDAWVLEETSRAKERRAQIKKFAAEALAGVGEIGIGKPSGADESFGISWQHVRTTRGVRVLSTMDAAETQRIALLCEAAAPFFARTLGIAPVHPLGGFTVYVPARKDEKQLFVERSPDLGIALRALAGTVVSLKVPGRPVIATWDLDSSRRVDSAVRHTISDFLERSFGLSMRQGWIYEGFGLYLTRELAGSRLTWFIQPASGGRFDPLKQRLMVPEANWMNECLELLRSPDRPTFTELVERDVDAMTVADMLYAYALAAYVLEGRPAASADLLTRIGARRQSTGEALRAVLGMPLPDLEERLERWLSERR